MHPYAWLIAFSSFTATVIARPGLPHFELQQAGVENEASNEPSTRSKCKRIAELTNLSEVAANQTLRDVLLADHKVSQEQVDYIETNQDAIESELQEFSSDTALMAECGTIQAHRKAVKDCKKMDKLEQLVELANNKTAYDEHLAGELLNQKQTEQLKKNMEEAEIKLQKMRTNGTLVELCANEVGLRQNGAAHQQAGGIGEAAVDNSGAISVSTSDATLLRSKTWLVSPALGLVALGAVVLL
ncbi:hypothetical protein OPT61_g1339 [Boeremia exigua]|uniref:Uncharacterized protein n=1 Tax=Boeremia exigua TaxID=749465 RepID=A0ACC2IQJ4_9PLEO|nr:hypothetical protein OPT61_g1339 [Boeremia exigua]